MNVPQKLKNTTTILVSNSSHRYISEENNEYEKIYAPQCS